MRGALRALAPPGIRLRASAARRAMQRLRRRRSLSRAARLGGPLAVYYGRDSLPSPNEPATGGILKFQRLAETLPNSADRFNLVYLGSNSLPSDWPFLLDLLRERGIPLVYNQDGVAYPGWYGPGWEEANRPMASLMAAADHVFFQSRFCGASAERYLGPRPDACEVLYNAVDTDVFVPAPAPPPRRPLRLLLSGKQYQDFPVETAVRTLGCLRRNGIDARLLITGRLTWDDEREAARHLGAWMSREGVADRVELLGPYSQSTATAIHHQAHLLLHTKYNDACPSGVIEAMACGLPVVYSASGGVPELVGDEAGRGIQVAQGWDRMATPDPEALASAVVEVSEKLEGFAESARSRAVARYDIRRWTARHLDVFSALVAGRPVPAPPGERP